MDLDLDDYGNQYAATPGFSADVLSFLRICADHEMASEPCILTSGYLLYRGLTGFSECA